MTCSTHWLSPPSACMFVYNSLSINVGVIGLTHSFQPPLSHFPSLLFSVCLARLPCCSLDSSLSSFHSLRFCFTVSKILTLSIAHARFCFVVSKIKFWLSLYHSGDFERRNFGSQSSAALFYWLSYQILFGWLTSYICSANFGPADHFILGHQVHLGWLESTIDRVMGLFFHSLAQNLLFMLLKISYPLGILHMMHGRGWVPCKGWMVENGRSFWPLYTMEELNAGHWYIWTLSHICCFGSCHIYVSLNTVSVEYLNQKYHQQLLMLHWLYNALVSMVSTMQIDYALSNFMRTK